MVTTYVINMALKMSHINKQRNLLQLEAIILLPVLFLLMYFF